MKKLFLLSFIFFTAFCISQSTRLWTSQERWANMTGEEALIHAGVSTANAANVPDYLRADGAIVWAINEGFLSSDNASYLDTRTLVSNLQVSLGSATLPYTTTSPNDPLLKDGRYNVYAWLDVTGGNTSRINLAERVYSGGNRDLRTTQGRDNIIADVAAQGGDRKVIRINRPQFTNLSNGDRSDASPAFLDVKNGHVFPSMDIWKVAQKADFKAWATYCNNAGMLLDLIIIDTEVRAWEPQDVSAGEWTNIKSDVSWSTLSAELTRYGFDISGNPTTNFTNRAAWNHVMSLRLNRALLYILEGIREVYPNVKFAEYEQRNLTGRHYPYTSGWYIHFGWGGPHENVVNSNKGDFVAPEVYGISTIENMPWGLTYPKYHNGGINGGAAEFDIDWRSSWETFVQDQAKVNTQIASANHPIMPWVASKVYLDVEYNNTQNLNYWEENIYHLAIKGAEDFLWYNQNSPQNVATMEAAMSEIDAMLPWQEKRPLDFEPYGYRDKDYIISGCDTGGKLIYRVTWDDVAITDPANQITWPTGTITYDANGIGAWVVDSNGTPSGLFFQEDFEVDFNTPPHFNKWLTENKGSQVGDAREGSFAKSYSGANIRPDKQERVEDVMCWSCEDSLMYRYNEVYHEGYSKKVMKKINGFGISDQDHAIPPNADFTGSASAKANGFAATHPVKDSVYFYTATKPLNDPSIGTDNGALTGLKRHGPFYFPFGKWNDVTRHFKYTTDNTGFHEIRLNSKIVVDEKNTHTVYENGIDVNGNPAPNFPAFFRKFGGYSGGVYTGHVVYDAVRAVKGLLGTYDDVAPRNDSAPLLQRKREAFINELIEN